MNLEIERFPGELRMLREIQKAVSDMTRNEDTNKDDHFINALVEASEDFIEVNEEFIRHTEAFKSGRTGL